MDEDRTTGRYMREGPSGKLIAAGVALLLLVIFVLQNRDRANVDILFWDVDARIWTVIVISAALGFVIGWVLGRTARRSGRADDR